MQEREKEIMAAVLDIFDQEKVWDMALKAERREGKEEGREEGFAAGINSIISICREMVHMEDREVIETLMGKMSLTREKAEAYLYEYDHPGSDSE